MADSLLSQRRMLTTSARDKYGNRIPGQGIRSSETAQAESAFRAQALRGLANIQRQSLLSRVRGEQGAAGKPAAPGKSDTPDSQKSASQLYADQRKSRMDYYARIQGRQPAAAPGAAPAPGATATTAQGRPASSSVPILGGVLSTTANLPTEAQSRKAKEKASLLRQVREESARSTATRGDILDRLNAERRAAGKTAIDISAKEFAAEDIAAREAEAGVRRGIAGPPVSAMRPEMEGPPAPPPAVGPPVSAMRPEMEGPPAPTKPSPSLLRGTNVVGEDVPEITPYGNVNIQTRGGVLTAPPSRRAVPGATQITFPRAMAETYRKEESKGRKTPLLSAAKAYGAGVRAYLKDIRNIPKSFD